MCTSFLCKGLTSASFNLLGNVHIEIQLLKLLYNKVQKNEEFSLIIFAGILSIGLDLELLIPIISNDMHGKKIEFEQHGDFSGLFDFYDNRVIFVSLNSFQNGIINMIYGPMV